MRRSGPPATTVTLWPRRIVFSINIECLYFRIFFVNGNYSKQLSYTFCATNLVLAKVVDDLDDAEMTSKDNVEILSVPVLNVLTVGK